MEIEKYLKLVCPYTDKVFIVQDQEAFIQHIKKQERKRRQQELKDLKRETIALEIAAASKNCTSWSDYHKRISAIANTHKDAYTKSVASETKKLAQLDTVPPQSADLITTTHSAPQGKRHTPFFKGPRYQYLGLSYQNNTNAYDANVKSVHITTSGIEVYASDFKHVAALIIAMDITSDPRFKMTRLKLQMSILEKKEGDYVQTVEDLALEMFGWDQEKFKAVAQFAKGMDTEQCLTAILRNESWTKPSLEWFDPN